MLLIDHRQTQPMELHTVLKQGVGADHQRQTTARQPFQNRSSHTGRVTTRQQGAGHARLGKQRGQPLVVLAGQNVGGCHQGRLKAAVDGVRQHQRRHGRLARADIALEQPRHLLAMGQIAPDVRHRPLLRPGQGEGQGGQ